MTTKDITGISAPNKGRTKLADVIPLKAPLIVQIFPIYACNLECCFCHYGIEKDKRPQLTTKPVMELDLFKKVIDEIAQFPDKIKMLRFVGEGEPLLHKNIVEMVKYASGKNVAEKLELITNGILLTPQMSKDLINAGLERIRVSIYGISSKTYKENSKRDINFDDIVNNVRFFYEEKQKINPSIQMYVKTMDCSLENEQEKEKFIELFGKSCDYYAIESVIPIVPEVDYSKWMESTPDYNASGIKIPGISVCPQPYHLVTIRPDGGVIPCCNGAMYIVGNCNKESLIDIWNGTALKNCQKKMLDGNKKFGGLCADCGLVTCRPFPEDILDNDVERLKKLYE